MTLEPEDEMILRVLERTARAAESGTQEPRADTGPGPAGPGLAPEGTEQAADPDRARLPRKQGQSRKVRVLPGFSGKARVTTSFGALPIEALRKRDELRTSTGRLFRVVAIDKILLDGEFLAHHPEAVPFRVRAGSLGRGLPQRDVLLSPRQKIVTTNVASISGAKVVEDMRGLPGILPIPADHAVYYRFHVGEPAMVQVEGMWVLIEP